jgi:hypothetical protein
VIDPFAVPAIHPALRLIRPSSAKSAWHAVRLPITMNSTGASGFRFAHPGFCNGPWFVNPCSRCDRPFAGVLLLSGVGALAAT